jgi:ketol-acid reductoisomerase
MTFFSTEAENLALNETVREVKFTYQLLETMGVKKMKSAHVDNIGYIFLERKKTSGQRTKHKDIKYHFIEEQIENGLVVLEISFKSNHLALLV